MRPRLHLPRQLPVLVRHRVLHACGSLGRRDRTATRIGVFDLLLVTCYYGGGEVVDKVKEVFGKSTETIVVTLPSGPVFVDVDPGIAIGAGRVVIGVAAVLPFVAAVRACQWDRGRYTTQLPPNSFKPNPPNVRILRP